MSADRRIWGALHSTTRSLEASSQTPSLLIPAKFVSICSKAEDSHTCSHGLLRRGIEAYHYLSFAFFSFPALSLLRPSRLLLYILWLFLGSPMAALVLASAILTVHPATVDLADFTSRAPLGRQTLRTSFLSSISSPSSMKCCPKLE